MTRYRAPTPASDTTDYVRMLVTLRVDLAARREAGEDFSEAWQCAVNGTLATFGREQRRGWRWALTETRGGWELAYCGDEDVATARVADLETAVV